MNTIQNALNIQRKMQKLNEFWAKQNECNIYLRFKLPTGSSGWEELELPVSLGDGFVVERLRAERDAVSLEMAEAFRAAIQSLNDRRQQLEHGDFKFDNMPF